MSLWYNFFISLLIIFLHQLGSFVGTTFNCTEEEIASLMSSAMVYQGMLDRAARFRRFCKDCSWTMYMQWIQENIPCEGEGIIVREYISDPANEFNLRRERIDLTSLRCAS